MRFVKLPVWRHGLAEGFMGMLIDMLQIQEHDRVWLTGGHLP